MGYMDDEFGSNSKNKENFMERSNTKSFHIGWSDLPKDTKTIAILFYDYDAIPVCGFPWMHWSVENIDLS